MLGNKEMENFLHYAGNLVDWMTDLFDCIRNLKSAGDYKIGEWREEREERSEEKPDSSSELVFDKMED